VGERSKICAGSCALRNVPADSFVIGVPGRVVSRIEFEREL
jgi:serine O-acetyltransferase